MVKSDAFGWPTVCARFAAQACPASVPLGGVKLIHTDLPMGGTNGYVWPMSPWDGSTG